MIKFPNAGPPGLSSRSLLTVEHSQAPVFDLAGVMKTLVECPHFESNNDHLMLKSIIWFFLVEIEFCIICIAEHRFDVNARSLCTLVMC